MSPRIATFMAKAAMMVLVPLTACHARGGTSASAPPLLTALSPTQVSIIGGNAATLTLRGRGFDSLNTVHFGTLRIPGVPRTNDSVMQFAVPTDDTFLPNRGPAPIQSLSSGRYNLRVENRFGTSNAISVTLIAGGELR